MGLGDTVTHLTPDGQVMADVIRHQLRERDAIGRCTDLTNDQIHRVVDHVQGYLTLAIEALAMRPWPTWMTGVLFPGRTSRP